MMQYLRHMLKALRNMLIALRYMLIALFITHLIALLGARFDAGSFSVIFSGDVRFKARQILHVGPNRSVRKETHLSSFSVIFLSFGHFRTS
jgi:hypothetical protein